MLQPRPNPRTIDKEKEPTLLLTYTYRCCVCQEKVTQHHPMTLEMEPIRPGPPEGWKLIDRRLVCGKHSVTVSVTTPEAYSHYRWEVF